MTRTLCVRAKLQNLLIERASCNVESPLEDDVAGRSGEVHLQGDCDFDETRCNRNRASEKCPLRVIMTRELNLNGMRRPSYHFCRLYISLSGSDDRLTDTCGGGGRICASAASDPGGALLGQHCLEHGPLAAIMRGDNWLGIKYRREAAEVQKYNS